MTVVSTAPALIIFYLILETVDRSNRAKPKEFAWDLVSRTQAIDDNRSKRARKLVVCVGTRSRFALPARYLRCDEGCIKIREWSYPL